MTETIATAGLIRRNALPIVITSAFLWGVYWIPVRTLESAGVFGLWSGLLLAAGALVPCALLVMVGPGARLDGRQLLGALAIGFAIAFYSVALSYSDVIRVILLFYLAPVWSTIIECLFFGRRWTWSSTFALGISFAGIIVICRGEVPLEGVGALGDWMALGAGLAWSIGAALVFSRNSFSLPALTGASMAAAIAVCGGMLLVAGPQAPAGVEMDLTRALIIALAFGTIYVAPVMIATIWGALVFPPAKMSFILTAEIVAGVTSGALLLGEPFGLPEIIGSILIATGAVIEIVLPKRTGPASDSG